MRVNDNEGSDFNFLTPPYFLSVINHHFPELENASPKGWEPTPSGYRNIWIPKDRVDRIDVDKIRKWAEFACNQCVWLKLGKNLENHFTGTELDLCVAADFSGTFDDVSNFSRSELGMAEYQLKYNLRELTQDQKLRYFKPMENALLAAFDLLPLSLESTVVSSIPSQKGSSRIAVGFAGHVAKCKECEFIEPRLLVAKPEMKGLPLGERVEMWNTIYSTTDYLQLEPEVVQGRDVVIVDDLYQSGATMWSYAKALKGLGARKVFGLVCVKSMKDSDNK